MISGMNLLFVCNLNRLRSATAEAVFSGLRNHAALSAGLSKGADKVISGDLVEWADVVFTMDAMQCRKLREAFSSGLRHKRVVVLNIVDKYRYMDPELVELLLQKVNQHIEIGPLSCE